MSVIAILLATIYLLCGYSAFIVFIIFKNHPSAVLGLITGVTYSILLYLHILTRKGKLFHFYAPSNLHQICSLGFVVFSIGFLSLVYYSAMEIMLRREILPISTSFVLPIIWSLISLKGGLTLMYYTLKYSRLSPDYFTSDSDTQVIVQSTSNEDVDD